jgi:hypothetical protein
MKRQAIVHGGQAVGALMPDGNLFRFVAVKFSVWALDGRLFESPEAVQHAVKAHFEGDLLAIAAMDTRHAENLA